MNSRFNLRLSSDLVITSLISLNEEAFDPKSFLIFELLHSEKTFAKYPRDKTFFVNAFVDVFNLGSIDCSMNILIDSIFFKSLIKNKHFSSFQELF